MISALLPSGSPNVAHASSWFKTPSKSTHDHDLLIALTNATNTTNTTAPTHSPTPANPPSAPTPPPTHEPTKKYEPPPDDNEDEGESEGAKIGKIFLWTFVTFALIWLICYFRDPIIFFFVTVSYHI